ncbi:MAG: N-acetylmuramoyl-L-alanine amidase [Lachnospiraceae bacterium]|nr:N-acetylmuramoyl-L-alanine amidase [Lachnospiraceae bacterium]
MTKKMTGIAAGFILLFMGVTVYRALTRPALVTAAAVEQSATTSFDEERRLPMTIVGQYDPPFVKWRRDDLEIPLPEGVTRNDLVVENHWTTGEVRVHFPQGAVASYLEEVIHADEEKVLSGTLVPDGADGMVLCFETDRVYEVTSHYETDTSGTLVLSLHFTPPQELYEKIVVIDPVCGGEDAGKEGNGFVEKEIALSVCEVVQERLERDVKETGVKVYVTRTWDETVTEEARTALATALDADLYVRVGVSDDAAREGISVEYNEVFFGRGLQNVTLADLLARHVSVSTGQRAAGLFEAYGEDEVLTSLTIPAAKVSVGSVASDADAAHLGDDNFHRRAAEGIYKAVLEAVQR